MIEAKSRPRLPRRLRLRPRRPDHQGQGLVLRRVRADLHPLRLHPDRPQPHRLPRRPGRRHPVGLRPPADVGRRLRRRQRRPRSEDRLLHHRPARQAHGAVDRPRNYQILGKINFAVTPEHQGQLSAIIQPGSGRTAGIYGTPQSTTYEYSGMVADLSAKWTSKFNDNKTEIEGVLGYHRSTYAVRPRRALAPPSPFQDVIFGNMGTLSGFGAESDNVKAGCFDDVDPKSTRDPYPLITNCPDNGVGYSIGGGGNIDNTTEQRMSAKLSVTQRLKALGSHEIKAGIDAENNLLSKARLYSGGGAIENYLGGTQDIRVLPLGPAGPAGHHRPALRQHVPDPGRQRQRACRAPSRTAATTWPAPRATRAPRSRATPSTGRPTCATRGRSGRTSPSTTACATRSSACATPRVCRTPSTRSPSSTSAPTPWSCRACSPRASACSTTGPRRAARRSTATGAGSTSRCRWTSTTARSAARSCTIRTSAPTSAAPEPDVGHRQDRRRRRHRLRQRPASGRLAAGAAVRRQRRPGRARHQGAVPRRAHPRRRVRDHGRPQDRHLVPEPAARPGHRGRVDRRRLDLHHLEPGRDLGQRPGEPRGSHHADRRHDREDPAR